MDMARLAKYKGEDYMENGMTMQQFSQMIFKSAFEKLVPEIMQLREKDMDEEAFHNEVIPKVEAMAEAIYNSSDKEDIESLMPEVFQAVSLPFLIEKPIFENFIKQSKREEFRARVFASFTTTALLMAIGKIFEWSTTPGTEATVDSEGTESEESAISE